MLSNFQRGTIFFKVGKQMKIKTPIISIVISLLLLSVSSLPLSVFADGDETSDPDSKILYNAEFEDGTQGWAPLGAGSLSIDNKNFHSGKSSIHIKDRTAMWNGPSFECIDFIALDSEAYFSAWAYQESGAAEQIFLTLKLTNSNGNTVFNNIYSADSVSGEWVQMQGSAYIGPDIVSAVLYVESPNENLEYNIDDIIISGKPVESLDASVKKEEEQDNTLPKYQYNFENSFDEWVARGDGSVRVIRTDEYSSSGKYSLYITDRTAEWNGAMVDIDNIPRSVSYNYSTYVMYNGKKYGDKHTFLIQLQYELNGNTLYEVVGQKEIQKNSWSKISGVFVLPPDAKKVSFYVQTENVEEGNPTEDDLMPFYIDQITIEDSTAAVLHKKIITAAKIVACVIGLVIIGSVIFVIIKKSRKTKAALLLASTDAMTQTFNRNSYEERLDELEKLPDVCAKLHFILCDVNFLKYINDNYGHEKGDDAIIRCGRLLMNAIGKKGKVYRTGGDEFMCICDVSLEKEIKQAIEVESKKYEGYPFAVAVGSSSYDKDTDGDKPDLKEIIKRCDTKMYENKQKIKEENKDFSRQ